MNTTVFLNIATAICPDRDIISFEGKHYSFALLNERSNRLANALAGLGVKHGDRVGMLEVNCNQHIEVYFATAKLGAIFVPINFRAKADEVSYMLDNAKIKVLFAGSRYIQMLDTILPKLSFIENCVSTDKKLDGTLAYETLVSSSVPDEVAADIGDEDITILMYTAGTTGRPKGVPLRHSAFAGYVIGNVEPANPIVEERNLLSVPLYHIAGIQAMLAAVYGGRTLVLIRQFEVKEWMRIIQEEKVSRTMLVPTMLKWVLDDPDFDHADLSSLKVITYGSASMPFAVIKSAIEKMPWVKFINAFGQTETASTITVLGPDDHVIEGTEEEKEKKLKRLSASIGKPLSDVQIKIVDESGQSLPYNAVGEILAKGARIMSGYWKDDEKTARAKTKDGWLKTGDKGWVDEDGYVFLAGRGDDMIIRGGENISPEEVEDVLHSHPDIEETAVIGIPDPEWGQEPCAVVTLKNGKTTTAEEIMEYCRSRLAGFKRPRQVIFVESLPRNTMGKVLRKELRTNYEQLSK
ncbi:MAG: long-chain-fatty-acid--CoA ligase [Deltaproteobacteria bacterium]|uniref:class I adenylate-forming enzyme family protein n=1 Tax=Desulfobacula sp. TaxID=2593537 RepID=UPI001982AA52|nr:long-chain-fatty-acid--CoA ligase [Candidatus Desulfobacula maris]MBL6993758.1 long-chain-fatty-acid--CoA ligase [Desulfobacula sp.]